MLVNNGTDKYCSVLLKCGQVTVNSYVKIYVANCMKMWMCVNIRACLLHVDCFVCVLPGTNRSGSV